jgi:hypothetical protein
MSLHSSLRHALIPALVTLVLLPAAASAAEPGVTPTGPIAEEISTIDTALKNADDGHKWVRIFFDWSQLQPSDGPIDPHNQLPGFKSRIQQFRARGINVAAVVTQAPSWVDVNSAQGSAKYAALMTDLAKRFEGEVDVWEIWNEPDGSVHWPNGPQPAAYARLLKEAYAAIKNTTTADPLVITGGMVGNNFDFLSDLYAQGAGGSFDGVGVHTDTACLLRDPSFYYREPSGRVGRFSFTGYREVYRTMQAHGDAAKQIWMTEFGWAESVGSGFSVTCSDGVDAGKKPAGVTRAQQADFAKQAFACMAPDAFVRMASWFTLKDPDNFRTTPWGYGLIDSSGATRPVLGSMTTASTGNGAGAGSNPGCGGKVDTDAPNSTIDVPDRFFNRLVVRGSANDPTTPVSKIELWVDGKRVEGVNQDGGKYELDWFGSSKLSYGKHTFELRAYDEALNVGVAKKVVERANASSAARLFTPRVKFKVRKKGRKFIVTGSILRALTGEFTERPRGGMRILFQWKRKKKFVLMKRTGKNANHTFRYVFKATRPGKWRVRGLVLIDAPYKNVKVKPYTFRVR